MKIIETIIHQQKKSIKLWSSLPVHWELLRDDDKVEPFCYDSLVCGEKKVKTILENIIFNHQRLLLLIDDNRFGLQLKKKRNKMIK